METKKELSRERIRSWLETISRDQHWCILISADPDAMGAAQALRRIMERRTRYIDICSINKVTRPDNLAMIRYLRLNIKPWDTAKQSQYTHFALVDSQPHHNPVFKSLYFTIVVDHHPLPRPDQLPERFPLFSDVRPDVGATCTIMTSYLRLMRIRPSARLATALLLGIRTDTASFERSGGELDLEAYHWLSRRADAMLLRRIVRSEYLRSWLPLFARAFRNLTDCRGTGAHAWIGEVSSPDLLVAIADFFTHVHGLHWIAVSGVVQKTVIVIFRCDGTRDIGRLADACFYDVGSAGGHRNLARAEFPVSAVPKERSVQEFIRHRLTTRKLRPRSKIEQAAAGSSVASRTAAAAK